MRHGEHYPGAVISGSFKEVNNFWETIVCWSMMVEFTPGFLNVNYSITDQVMVPKNHTNGHHLCHGQIWTKMKPGPARKKLFSCLLLWHPRSLDRITLKYLSNSVESATNKMSVGVSPLKLALVHNMGALLLLVSILCTLYDVSASTLHDRPVRVLCTGVNLLSKGTNGTFLK